MSKLLSQGGFGCIFYPGVKCDGKQDPRTTVVTKLQRKDFNADNEILIGELIMAIPNYKLFFLPVMSSCSVNIRDIDSQLINECRVVAKGHDVPFVLMTIPFVSNRGFFEVLTDASMGKNQVILTIMETYTYLLSAIKYLLDINIVHFDLKGDNILYNTITTDPQIIDFGISLPIKQLTSKNWNQYFYVYAPEYYVWPLEVHAIGFILHEGSNKLSSSDVRRIAQEYVSFNKALDVFSSDFRTKYQQLCEVCLESYVGKSGDEVIPQLIKKHVSWDNYSLSILYLKTFSYMFPRGIHRNSILIRFSQLLALNISPDFSVRLSLEETKRKFSEIFYIEGDTGDYKDMIRNFDYSSTIKTRQIKEDINKLRSIKAKTIRALT